MDEYDKVRKDKPTKSIWDKDVDVNKLGKLSPAEKHRLFPNDYAPGGAPYGDF